MFNFLKSEFGRGRGSKLSDDLDVAVSRDDVAAVRLALSNGADPGTRVYTDGESALHTAAWQGSLVISTLLLDHRANLNAADVGGQAHLHIAAQRGSPQVVRLLLERGANPQTVTRARQTALYMAAQEGFRNVAMVLLEHKADVKITAGDGFGSSARVGSTWIRKHRETSSQARR